MTFTEHERKVYEDIVSELYGRRIILQPTLRFLTLDLAVGAGIDLDIGYIFVGNTQLGLNVAGTIEEGILIATRPSGIERVQTFTYEVSGFFNSPMKLFGVYDRIIVNDYNGETQQTTWCQEGYIGLIK